MKRHEQLFQERLRRRRDPNFWGSATRVQMGDVFPVFRITAVAVTLALSLVVIF